MCHGGSSFGIRGLKCQGEIFLDGGTLESWWIFFLVRET